MRHLRLIVPFGAAAIVLAACGSSYSGSSATTAAGAVTTVAGAAATTAAAPTTDSDDAAYGGGATPTTAAASPAAGGSTVAVADTSVGKVLVDGSGMTLYLFTKDSPNTSVCTGGCIATWPALAASGAPTGGDGVDASKLGTMTRADGTTQVTYAGWPLYTYAKDKAAGDVTGQGVGGVWFAVLPTGTAAG